MSLRGGTAEVWSLVFGIPQILAAYAGKQYAAGPMRVLEGQCVAGLAACCDLLSLKGGMLPTNGMPWAIRVS